MSYVITYGPITFGGDYCCWNGFTCRTIIPANLLTTSGSLVKVKMGHYSGDWEFGACYIGHQAVAGDVYDFDGNQQQVLFGGLPGATVTAGGLESDVVTFDLDETKNLIIAVYVISTSPPGLLGAFALYYKEGNDAATEDASGYASDAQTKQFMVESISVTDPPPPTPAMGWSHKLMGVNLGSAAKLASVSKSSLIKVMGVS